MTNERYVEAPVILLGPPKGDGREEERPGIERRERVRGNIVGFRSIVLRLRQVTGPAIPEDVDSATLQAMPVFRKLGVDHGRLAEGLGIPALPNDMPVKVMVLSCNDAAPHQRLFVIATGAFDPIEEYWNSIAHLDLAPHVHVRYAGRHAIETDPKKTIVRIAWLFDPSCNRARSSLYPPSPIPFEEPKAPSTNMPEDLR